MSLYRMRLFIPAVNCWQRRREEQDLSLPELLYNLPTSKGTNLFKRGLKVKQQQIALQFYPSYFSPIMFQNRSPCLTANVFHPVLTPSDNTYALYSLSFTPLVFFQQNIFPYTLVMTRNNFNHSQWRWKQAKRQEVLLVLHSCNSWQVEVLSDMFL